ncbi:MAG TPA: alpha/beta hydrolase [Candidatus Paceibacterota bacterium]
MDQQVLYIHGGNAYSSYEDFLQDLRTMALPALRGEITIKRWSETLRQDLGEGFEVIAPSMPNKHNAKYLEWKIWFERHFELLRDDLILVGWSQGGYFLTKYLIENDLPVSVRGLILIAAPFEPAQFGKEDGGDFQFDTSKAGLLQEKVPSITIFHSQDDFIVPFAHAEMYKQALPNAELVTFSDRNHFLLPEFPELLERIKELSR